MAHEELSPLNITPGAIRFNTDSMKLEYFRIGMEGGSTSSYAGIGNLAAGEWVQLTTDSPDIQTGGTRGLNGGGYVAPSGKQDVIDYINLATTGDAIDFGNLTAARYWISSHASSTRGVWGAGGVHPGSPNRSDVIDYVTIASTGDAIDFGNLTAATYGTASCSNSTRGLFTGGSAPGDNTETNNIDYITIASTGDARDFGDLSVAGYYLTALASSTRGVFLSRRSGAGASPNPFVYHNTIDYVTISTQGNAADFGDLTATGAASCAASNSTRGIYTGNENGTTNSIQYITISTLGNAQEFGDLLVAGLFGSGAAASSTRVTIAGGYISPTNSNVIQYVQIPTTGDAVDFGNLTVARYSMGSCSNGHGGLG